MLLRRCLPQLGAGRAIEVRPFVSAVSLNNVYDVVRDLAGSKKAEAACIVTRNPADYAAGDMPIQTPREFLSTYTVK